MQVKPPTSRRNRGHSEYHAAARAQIGERGGQIRAATFQDAGAFGFKQGGLPGG
jgi:hypothetical protein